MLEACCPFEFDLILARQWHCKIFSLTADREYHQLLGHKTIPFSMNQISVTQGKGLS